MLIRSRTANYVEVLPEEAAAEPQVELAPPPPVCIFDSVEITSYRIYV